MCFKMHRREYSSKKLVPWLLAANVLVSPYDGNSTDFPQLLQNRLSDNVGAVKKFLSTLQHALVEERHFALVEAVAFALPT
jgi:hypothetical protein